jgi:hypothetical protein
VKVPFQKEEKEALCALHVPASHLGPNGQYLGCSRWTSSNKLCLSRSSWLCLFSSCTSCWAEAWPCLSSCWILQKKHNGIRNGLRGSALQSREHNDRL